MMRENNFSFASISSKKSMDIIDYIKRKSKVQYLYDRFLDILVKLNEIWICFKNKLRQMLLVIFFYFILTLIKQALSKVCLDEWRDKIRGKSLEDIELKYMDVPWR